MKFKTIEEVLYNTFNLVNMVDNLKKSPCEDLKLSMYNAIQKDFENNLKLLIITSDFDLEKKQLKFMLRKTKRLRKQAWRLSFKQIANEYKKNKLNMYAFDFNSIDSQVRKYRLFDKNKKPRIVS